MKLYTEKELRKAMTLMANIYSIYDEVFEQIVPIELPSDEDIYSLLRGKKMFDKDWGFIEGAKWMKEQITKKP